MGVYLLNVLARKAKFSGTVGGSVRADMWGLKDSKGVEHLGKGVLKLLEVGGDGRKGAEGSCLPPHSRHCKH